MAAPTPAPSLVVLVVVDQMAARYVDRYGAELTGGLARLLAGGAVFTRAYQDYAITETAPGHATMLSGRFPRSTGITANAFGVEDAKAPVLNGKGPGASPRAFKGTTLVDWMVAANPASRALSVSMKDRGAILPLGRAKQSVFWYTLDGTFTTSRYYADSLPTWVSQFNRRNLARRTAGQSWELLQPPAAYAEADSSIWEAEGTDYLFPHVIPADSTAAASYVRATPFMDRITLDLALDGLEAMRLGTGPAPDLLSISLSATDIIGHRYGPDSREAHDNVLQLDQSLGVFLDSLFRLRDSAHVAIVLTSDHGVASLPELSPGIGEPGGPMRVDLAEPMKALDTWLVRQGVKGTAVLLENGALMVNRSLLAAAKVNPDTVAARFVALAQGQPGVFRAEAFAALAQADTVSDEVARRWVHMFPADGPVVAVVTLTPGSVWGTRLAAEHGTPQDYDAHVPLIFFGPWFRPGRCDAFVRIVDVAPTLATILGVEPTEPLDGRPLDQALR